ncbi:exosortase E/protease, VPEID-CTERM system [Puniceibacterium sediminis]|uniref:CAAX prenyl protease 2/Lysostaphin resistance protein A-like domain-containing protein n=1 Tax=Puniceibacterium sediminis TaxID=1608407 RepID=A0A238ZDH2_9RHOB|nr:exosortase E/protease, VPEID-CTERM system [Puniceibacterium sediminis]SNR81132.1 hypothetical protein SAMN06265370_1299 [Puniceibacterium sediminis]
MAVSSTHPSAPRKRFALVAIGGLVGVELLLLSLLYQHDFVFTCRDSLPVMLCAALGRAVPRAVGILAALSLFAVARRGRISGLWGAPDLRRGLWVNLAGFAFILAPWALLTDASGAAVIAFGALLWLVGLAIAATGVLRMIAPAQAWRNTLAGQGSLLVALFVVGALLPEIGAGLMPLWSIPAVTDITFAAVRLSLEALGYAPSTDIAEKAIGAGNFFVRVGPQCSGVEGFALITVFLTLYVALFRRDLRFPHALLLFPIGLLASWVFNVLRITALIVIGIEGAPELAIGGFHSHAGWLAFTLLSIGLIAVSRTTPAFAAKPRQTHPLPSFLSDPVTAQILPFIVFMASALLASTFVADPARVYPLRAGAVGAALALVWPWFRALPWRLDPVSLLTGAAVGLAWIASSPPAAEGQSAPFAGMGIGMTALWIGARVIGTTLLVPLIEEALFRGYLIDRLAPSRQVVPMIVAIVLGAVLFALLHDRWLAAGLSGVAFGALVWRSDNLTDAISAHAMANGLIVAWALATGAWHII